MDKPVRRFPPRWLRPRNWLIAPIRWYQKYLSPKKPPVCRFTPTCSAYAIEALQRHGALIGAGLALWRILRCNPLCRGGYDPVPKRIPFPGRREKDD